MIKKELIIKELIKEKPKKLTDVADFKRSISKKYKISFLSNIELLKAYHELIKKKRVKKSEKIENLLKTRPIRSLSGIINISVLTKPYPCPGRCLYCPIEKGLPKSYLSGEPAADRAKFFNFDPYLQTKSRIETLKKEGHPTDKIELRIVGGTWSFYPQKYQEWFLKRCFEACNEKKSKNLKAAQEINEKSKHRLVGISIETRSDFLNKSEILRLRKLGVTMVEIGVPTLFNDVLNRCQTDLTVEKIAKATKILKDSGFKVLYHVMPNLPGSDLKKDLKLFEILFEDQRFKPDWLKIYPVVVCQGSQLFKEWKKGKYNSYSDEKLIKLLIKAKTKLPYWVRLARLLRDIPKGKIESGCRISNIREVIKKEMAKKELFCRCIRCREIKEKYNRKEKIYLFREDYLASEGKEIFLSFENKERNRLFAYLRLRLPSENYIRVLKNSALIREIQTLGQMIAVGQKGSSPQHRGLGKKLVKEAEKITKKEFGLNKIAVIAGIGAREYFKNLGYRLKESYMIKNI